MSTTPPAADDERPPLRDVAGIVPVEGRGRLPFARLRGRPLVSHATAALRAAGIEVVDAELQGLHRTVVLHDPLCPLTPPGFVVDALAAASSGDVVVGCRPVTDTIKIVTGDRVGGTVDRESLMMVTSPVVLPSSVVGRLAGSPGTADFAALVEWVRVVHPVRFLEAPPLGRRVEDESAVLLLEACQENR